jgi:hypothetical protein
LSGDVIDEARFAPHATKGGVTEGGPEDGGGENGGAHDTSAEPPTAINATKQNAVPSILDGRIAPHFSDVLRGERTRVSTASPSEQFLAR